MVDVIRVFSDREQSLKSAFKTLENDKQFHDFDKACHDAIESMKSQLCLKIPSSVKRSLEAKIYRILAMQALALQKVYNSNEKEFLFEQVESCFKNRVRTALVINISIVFPHIFFDKVKDSVINYVNDAVSELTCIKVSIVFCAVFKLVLQDREEEKYFSTRYIEMCMSSDLSKWYDSDVKNPILSQLDDFEEKDSGWSFTRVNNLSIQINKINPFQAGSFIDLPTWIKNKRAVVNVMTRNNDCFAIAVISAIFPSASHAEYETSYPPYNRYLNFKGIRFPVSISDIPRFEKNNSRISVNVFCVDKKKEILTLYRTRQKKEHHVNLLLVTKGNTNHYCWIKSMSRLLAHIVTRCNRNKKYICDICLHYFYTLEKLKEHEVDCCNMNDCVVKLPPPGKNILKFSDFSKKLPVPFIVYADTECLLGRVSCDDPIKNAVSEHKIYAVAYQLVCAYNDSLSGFFLKRSPDCDAWFADQLKDIAFKVNEVSFITFVYIVLYLFFSLSF